MRAELRYEALSLAAQVEIEDLADRILARGGAVTVLAGPEAVTVPVRLPVPGTRAADTVLGHVALTRCTVDLGGIRGDGVRAGRDLTGAVAAAVCDAEAERGGSDAHEVTTLCARALARRSELARNRATLVRSTRLAGEP